MKCWLGKHLWEVNGPIAIGRNFCWAWCKCARCGVEKERYLHGTERNRYLAWLEEAG